MDQQKNEFKQFGILMQALNDIFSPDHELKPTTIEMYYRALAVYGLTNIEAGVKRIIATRRYRGLPMPAEIIEATKGTSDLKDAALKAWISFEESEFDTGNQKEVTKAVIKSMGGQQRFKVSTWDQITWMQKEFERRYAAVKTDAVNEKINKLLMSTHQKAKQINAGGD